MGGARDGGSNARAAKAPSSSVSTKVPPLALAWLAVLESTLNRVS